MLYIIIYFSVTMCIWFMRIKFIHKSLSERLALCLFSSGFYLKTHLSLLGRSWWSVIKVCICVVCWITVYQCKSVWVEYDLNSVLVQGFAAHEFCHVLTTTYSCNSLQYLVNLLTVLSFSIYRKHFTRWDNTNTF